MKRKLILCVFMLGFSTPVTFGGDRYYPVFTYDVLKDCSQAATDWRTELCIVLEAGTIEESISRMEKFLSSYRPGGMYDDAPHHRNVLTAKFELLRIYRMANQGEKFNELLKEIRNEYEPQSAR